MAVPQELAKTYKMTPEQKDSRVLGGHLGPVEQRVIAEYLANNPTRVTPREVKPAEPDTTPINKPRRSGFGFSALVSGMGLGIFRFH